jgi:isopentenyl diphosphate isomerase/L-lactate dehydrogenase-like FMN-dependent dehydrogenase
MEPYQVGCCIGLVYSLFLINGALWPKGDILLARAAEKAGVPFVLSTASNASIEDVARESKGDLWFQLNIVQGKLAEQMVRRADTAGYSTLVLTTDVWVNGNRERDLRNHFGLPMNYTPKLILDGALSMVVCQERRREADVAPIRPDVTRIKLLGGRCACCGERVTAQAPAGLE